MIGILIATHGDMATGMLDSVELIMGKQSNCQTISLCHGDSIELFGDSIRQAIINLDEGEGVLVFTDLFSASPYNQTAIVSQKLKEHKFRSVTGVNLPMLLEAFGRRFSDVTVDELATIVMETGKTGIKELFTELEKVM